MQQEKPPKQNTLSHFFSTLGPGVITGAADDDPSGIATYSIAGAQFGTSLLWTAWLTWPLMAFVQMMCARIGMVTGQGLAGALRQKFPHRGGIQSQGRLYPHPMQSVPFPPSILQSHMYINSSAACVSARCRTVLPIPRAPVYIPFNAPAIRDINLILWAEFVCL